MNRLLLQLAVWLVAAITVSGQEVYKDPDVCNLYVNLSSLFNNTDLESSEAILGFQELTWRPYEEQEESPCVYLTGTENRQLFIQIETDGELCIDTDIGNVPCSSGRIERCVTSAVGSGENQYIYFTCTQSCSTSSFPFKYRVIESADTGNLEYWCNDINSAPNDLYPEDIIYQQVGGTGVSFSRTFQQTPEPVGGSAVGILSSKFVLLLALAILL